METDKVNAQRFKKIYVALIGSDNDGNAVFYVCEMFSRAKDSAQRALATYQTTR